MDPNTRLENRGGEAVVTSITFTAVAGSLVILRWVSRAIVLRNPGVDDYLIVASLILSIALTICIYLQHQYGLGRHFSTLTEEDFVSLMKTLYASIPIYLTGLATTKASIVIQYMRVFVGDRIQRAFKISLGIVVAYGLWTFWSACFTCFPVAKFWNKDIKSGYCMNNTALWFSNASVNIATDILVFSLPMPVLSSLHLPRKQKVGLIIIFAVGLFVCITSILRLKSLYTASVSKDLTWDNVGAASWSAVELNVAIICACLPMLKPLLVRMFPHLLGSTGRQNSSGARAYGYGYADRAPRFNGGVGPGFGNTSTIKSTAGAEPWDFDGFRKDSGRGSGSGSETTAVNSGKDIELGNNIGRAIGGPPTGKIQVMTSITREIEEEGTSETSSDRDLVWRGDELRV